jgi:hypothetical protein
MLLVPDFDKINYLVPRCSEWTKPSGKKAPLEMQKLEMILSSPLPQNLIGMANLTTVEHYNAKTQADANAKVAKNFNDGLLVHALAGT